MGLTTSVARIRRRTWITIGAIVAVLAATAAVVFGVVLPSVQPATAQTRQITSAASLQTLQKTVTGTGTLAPLVSQSVDFASGVSGTVQTVDVTAGQTVTAGQKLASVDTLQVNATLLAAKATLATAQARASSATTSTAKAAATAQVAVDQAAVDAAQTAYDSTVLTAPIAGVVTSVNLTVGATAGSGSSSSASSSGTKSSSAATGSSSSSSSTSSSSSAFTIVSTAAWKVSVTVGEADLANIKVGNQVQLSLADGTAFFGTVSAIGMLPSTTSGSAAYPVTVNVTGSPTGLYDGVSATTAIVYERRTNVLTVPSAAVTTANGASTVTVVDAEGGTTKTTVTVGETNGTLTEITGGITEGTTVLVASFTPGSGNAGTTGRTGTGTGGYGGFGGGTGTFPGGGTGTTGGTRSGSGTTGQAPAQ